ncbi:ABC transporter permease [Phaeovulum sp.]|uniref:ABC transporter permease n=1 Tax=Phaeovulum sp. TaxID=2934796 RepID=UPI0035633495
MTRLPAWADVVLIPLMSIIAAFAISALVILYIGENPWDALKIMVDGALGSAYGWGYTLYYATNFMFTGLAVSIAFRASLFNIGGEGQAMLGGLGVAVVALAVPWPHWTLALPAAMLGGIAFGAIWAAIPGWLQARRGSHIVITTMMFNFIGAALLNYVLVNIMRPAGSMDPASAKFPTGAHLPTLYDLPLIGGYFNKNTPANISLFIALAACVAVWYLLFRSRLGYAIRAFGKSEKAAVYAGISPFRVTMYVMLLSGGLSGMMAINNVMGEAERLVLNAVEGAGFIGIAVALMGRNHPFGVFLAALLFGFLYQGGAELGLWTTIPIELRTVVQALVILFTGALDNMMRMIVERLFALGRRRRAA